MIFIASIFYVLHSLWFITIAVVILLAMYRKERKYITLTKLAFVLFLWFVFICWNPLYWPQQINRRLNRSSLITPDAPCIAEAYNDFLISPQYNGPYENTTQGQLAELNDIQEFLYPNPYTGYIQYEYDFNKYPGVFDHVPTPEEVLADRKDDCDGIAVVTVSLLIYLGYDAYVAESDSHWWTYVKIYNGTLDPDGGITHTIVYLNWWDEIGEPYLIFNQTAVILMQPLYISWWDQMTNPYYITIIQDAFFTDEFGFTLSELPYIALLPVAIFLLGFILSFSVGFPRKYEKKRMHLANALLASLVLGLTLVLILLLPTTLLMYGNFILLGSIGILAFVIERDYFTKWIWKQKN